MPNVAPRFCIFSSSFGPGIHLQSLFLIFQQLFHFIPENILSVENRHRQNHFKISIKKLIQFIKKNPFPSSQYFPFQKAKQKSYFIYLKIVEKKYVCSFKIM
jgi:hypothetical protein